MTYVIEQQRTTFKGNGEHTKRWHPIDCFEDKELAEKELANLNRRWVAYEAFRLIEQ